MAGLGRADQRGGLLGFAEMAGQARVPGQLLRHGHLVSPLEGGQEAVGVGGVVGGAVAA